MVSFRFGIRKREEVKTKAHRDERNGEEDKGEGDSEDTTEKRVVDSVLLSTNNGELSFPPLVHQISTESQPDGGD